LKPLIVAQAVGNVSNLRIGLARRSIAVSTYESAKTEPSAAKQERLSATKSAVRRSVTRP
jgi:hypothetical protein